MCLYCAPDYLVPTFVLYIEVYVIYKTCGEYEPNQTADYVVNPGLIKSKTPVSNGHFNIVSYTQQQQTTISVALKNAMDIVQICC